MSRSELPVEEILESLDLSRAEPGIGFLEALFARFNARVPFETASKIVREAEIADPAGKPRWPSVFWSEHLELGAGDTCFARVAAFDALLTDLGFATSKVLGRVLAKFDHAALLVNWKGEKWICDVGFPLPALLRAAEGEVETGLAGLRVTLTARGWRVELLGGVPEGPRELEIFAAPVTQDAFVELWRKTFHPDSRFLTSVDLRTQSESRVLSFSRGEVRVDDLHSRLRVPLTGSRPARLAELFGIDQQLLARAFGLSGDPDPQCAVASLSAYLGVDARPADAFAAIADRAGYRRLMAGVAEVVGEEEIERGWRLDLAAPAPPGGGIAPASLAEEVEPDVSGLKLAVRRLSPGSALESSYRAEQRGGKAYLVREAILSGPGEELLRNDSLRGRLAGTLAGDLLAWARLLGRSRV